MLVLDPATEVLHVEVIDQDNFSSDDPLGHLYFPILDILRSPNRALSGTWRLIDGGEGDIAITLRLFAPAPELATMAEAHANVVAPPPVPSSLSVASAMMPAEGAIAESKEEEADEMSMGTATPVIRLPGHLRGGSGAHANADMREDDDDGDGAIPAQHVQSQTQEQQQQQQQVPRHIQAPQASASTAAASSLSGVTSPSSSSSSSSLLRHFGIGSSAAAMASAPTSESREAQEEHAYGSPAQPRRR